MLSNAIENIRYVKYNCYEEFFSKIIERMRVDEKKCLMFIIIFHSMIHFLNFFGTFVTLIGFMWIYFLMVGGIDVSIFVAF